MESLIDHTLASKATISVYQNTHVLCPVSIIGVELLGTCLADDNRIDSLQMTGIGDQGQVNPLPTTSWTVIRRTQVVLDITSSGVEPILTFNRPCAAGELAEYLRQWLADDIAKDIEPPPVRHPDDDVLDAEVSSPIKHLLHARDERLTTLEAKPLGSGPLGGEEVLELRAPDEPVEHDEAAFLVVVPGLGGLDLLPEPVALVPVGDVHVLVADGAAVGLVELAEDLAEGEDGAVLGEEAGHPPDAEEELPVEVGVGEAVEAEVEVLGDGTVVEAEGVELGHHVAIDLVGPDEEEELHALLDGLAGDAGGGGGLGDEVAEEVVPGLVDGGGVGLPGALELLEVDAAGAVEEAVGEAGERDGPGRGGGGARPQGGGVEAAGASGGGWRRAGGEAAAEGEACGARGGAEPRHCCLFALLASAYE